MAQDRRPIPPLDVAKLERLALRYVERFATTRGKLADYLRRKIRERGWEGEAADPDALAGRMAELGYVDDRAYAEARATALGRRGLGARRVAGELRAARIGDEDAQAVAPGIEARAVAAALTFARRKRLGPYGPVIVERAAREKQLGAMLRAGHALDLARRIVNAPAGTELDEETLAEF
jgi:regulatory protein